ncbi:MAG: hypothetical protein GWN47_02935 [Woeseiaceae bacterium]|nr:hypothetical protein [Woeseiaceae bacterium]
MILSLAKRIFLPVAIAFLCYFAWRSRQNLVDVVRHAQPVFLLAAVLVWTMMNAFAAAFAAVFFKRRNESMTAGKAARIHIANLPARYIPGGVWHTVGRIADFRRHGIDARSISMFVLIENVLAVCLAFILAAAMLLGTLGSQGWGRVAAICALVSAIALLVMPLVLSARPADERIRIPARDYILLILIVAASWCFAAAAFVTYLYAFPTLVLQNTPIELAGSYLFSWAAGFVAVFAPQGIGVFEVVAADMLRGANPLMSMAALIAGFRLVILAADVTAWLALRLVSGSAVGERRDLLGDKPDQENNH